MKKPQAKTIPTCAICFDPFNKSTRKEVSCASCPLSYCRQCMKQYLLNIRTNQCPECKNPWDDDFIAKNMTGVFLKTEMKEHRKKLILEEAKTRFPHYQEYASRYIKAKKYMKIIENIITKSKKEFYESEYGKEFTRLQDAYLYVKNYNYDKSTDTYIENITYTQEKVVAKQEMDEYLAINKNYKPKIKTQASVTLTDLGIECEDHNYYITQAFISVTSRLVHNIGHPVMLGHISYMYTKFTDSYTEVFTGLVDRIYGEGAIRTEGVVTASKKEFIHGCPVNDCKGFLKSNWVCGLCDAQICDKCNIPKNVLKEHECNTDDIATAKMLRKESKHCPGCSVRISKIDGCNQMWCVQCHTTFDWTTGKIETTRTHNPHYYEWLRRTQGSVPREPGDTERVACEDVLINGSAYLKYIAPHNLKMVNKYMIDRYVTSYHIAVIIQWITDEYSTDEIHKYMYSLLWYNNTRYRININPINREADVQIEIIKYLANDIDEDELSKLLFKIKNNTDFNAEIHNNEVAILTIIRDLLLDCFYDKMKLEDANTAIRNAIDFGNENIKFINKKYNGSASTFAFMTKSPMVIRRDD